MSGFMAVLRHEVNEQRQLMLAAAVTALVPLTIALLPQGANSLLLDISAFTLSGLFTCLAAIFLGATTISQDLSFYFSRPVSGWSIWAGKLAAAVLLAAAGGFLILIPALLTGEGIPRALVVPTVLAWIASTLLLVVTAHALSLVLHSRSPWLLLDLVAACLIVALYWVLYQPLMLESVLLGQVLGILAVAIPLALLAGSAVQMVRARIDRRQAHRWFSLTFWPLLFLTWLGGAAYSRWALAASPEDLSRIDLALPARAANWVLLEGPTENRGGTEPTFLLNTSSGRSLRLSMPFVSPQYPQGVQVSSDGRRAVWLADYPTHGRSPWPYGIFTADLTDPEAEPVATPIVFSTQGDTPIVPRALALSADGSRLASFHAGRLEVHEIPSGRRLASFPVAGPKNASARLQFLDPGRLLFHHLGDGRQRGYSPPEMLGIYEADLAARRLTRVGGIEWMEDGDWSLDVSADGRRILQSNYTSQVVRVHHGRTGKVLRSLGFPREIRLRNVVLLAEDRIVFTVSRDGFEELTAFLPDSRTEKVLLRGAREIRIGPQPGPDHLLAASREVAGGPWKSWLLDLERGTPRLLGEGLVPVARDPVPVGSPETKLFLENNDRLVWLDPLRNEKRVVLDLR